MICTCIVISILGTVREPLPIAKPPASHNARLTMNSMVQCRACLCQDSGCMTGPWIVDTNCVSFCRAGQFSLLVISLATRRLNDQSHFAPLFGSQLRMSSVKIQELTLPNNPFSVFPKIHALSPSGTKVQCVRKASSACLYVIKKRTTG